MNYKHFDNLLGSRQSRKLANNTYVSREGSDIVIRLHGHPIIRYTPTTVTVDSCGYQTATTKERINRFSPIRIHQKNFNWYATLPYGTVKDFWNGLEAPTR